MANNSVLKRNKIILKKNIDILENNHQILLADDKTRSYYDASFESDVYMLREDFKRVKTKMGFIKIHFRFFYLLQDLNWSIDRQKANSENGKCQDYELYELIEEFE